MTLFGRRRLLRRYRAILAVFIRHGFGTFLDRLGILQHGRVRARRMPRTNRHAEHALSVGARLRLALEELGPTFIKLGQILSTRPDMLPHDVVDELEKLQDSVPPVPFESVRAVVEECLGAPLAELFTDFDPVPLAAASVAQVHRATAHNGRKVVVKVLRPDIEETIDQDLQILHDLAEFLDKKTRLGDLYDFTSMAKEFDNTIHTELDLRIEGENTDALRKLTARDEGIKVPEVVWTHTAHNVLTLEFIDGYAMKELERKEFTCVDKKKVAVRLATSVLNQILRDGFFHADPHPGNLIVLEDGTVAFIDLGMVGRLNGDRRVLFLEMLAGLVQKDSRMLVQAIMDLDSMTGPVNTRRLQGELDLLRDRFLELPFEEIKLGALFGEIFALAFSYRIRLPGEFTMLSKTLATLEGVVERIAPEVSLFEVAAPIVKERMKDLYSFDRIKHDALQAASEYGHLLSGLPGFLTNFMRKVEDENYTVKLRHENFEVYMGRISKGVSRISLSIALLSVSILTVGLAVALGTGLPVGSSLLPVLTVFVEAGLGIIVALLAWLLVTILTTKK